jgi:DNA-binding SARP family transcriptional activator
LSRYDFDREDYAACTVACKAILAVEPCNEETHRRLMRCYERLGQTHLALRQYHFCVDSLSRELNLPPSLETLELFRQIRNRYAV